LDICPSRRTNFLEVGFFNIKNKEQTLFGFSLWEWSVLQCLWYGILLLAFGVGLLVFSIYSIVELFGSIVILFFLITISIFLTVNIRKELKKIFERNFERKKELRRKDIQKMEESILQKLSKGK
jgi:hypothetical protein